MGIEIFTILILLAGIYLKTCTSYSAIEDVRLIEEYKQQLLNSTRLAPELNHAKIARILVHQANWASVGTISSDNAIKNYPMVNIISVNDNDASGRSSGRIQFLTTDMDFTGSDWHYNNKATMLFTDEQLLHCTRAWNSKDPMEPTCSRTIISGQIIKMDKNRKDYDTALVAFVERHPAAKNWLKAHIFYLCELNITNIYVLDYYGGPHNVPTAEYYNANISDYYKLS